MVAQLINFSTGNLVVNNYQVLLYQRLGVTGGIPVLLIMFWNRVGLWGNVTSAFMHNMSYARESFPGDDSAGSALSLFDQFAGTALFVAVSPSRFAAIGWKFYFVFLCPCTMDTKCLSLEEIDEIFGDLVAVHLMDVNKDQMEQLER
ncbi:hypothetical protein K469DRAFT_697476 [Zopfia rhizophila CBS 207.26]|uniref:Uncharacterized protein n=1 Tax=Zopfia rhizophila CBS 207.26 TaxID=1314779 RepID=A0A6A6DHP7_9PEZI|nr:hypothetical protein K469DRAFT_697476 [Zopfia rhizophila CBS 207.26]